MQDQHAPRAQLLKHLSGTLEQTHKQDPCAQMHHSALARRDGRRYGRARRHQAQAIPAAQ